jgi:hypothetical protein
MNQRGSGKRESQAQELAERHVKVRSNGAHPASGATSPLASAAERWLKRGYQVQYSDAYLVQLGAQVTGPESRDLALAAGIGVAVALLGALSWLAYLHLTRRGRWHEVSLTLTPERQVLTYGRYLRIPAAEVGLG